MNTAQPQYSQMDMGRPLVWGSGKGNITAILLWLAIYGGVALVCFILAGTVGFRQFYFMGTVVARGATRWFYVFLLLGFVSLALCGLTVFSLTKTGIAVHEYGIVGTGLTGFFFLGDVRARDFAFRFDAANVQIGNKMVAPVMVSAGGVRYRVFAVNAAEICNAVNMQRQHYGAMHRMPQQY